MLDIKWAREHVDELAAAMANRNAKIDLDRFVELERERRRLLAEVEEMKHRRNVTSQRIAGKKKRGNGAEDEVLAMRELGAEIKAIDGRVSEVEAMLESLMLEMPNVPHESVPVGPDESANVVVRDWGEAPEFDFEPKAHWDVGPALEILDFERAAKIARSRFVLYLGLGARLERALINFMLDLHTGEHGYTEVFPPILVNAESLYGTGQLPKFGPDLFRVEGENLYLIPTAEVPVTNIHRDEVLEEAVLPLKYCAYTPCFRSEAGAYGKETRGIIRQHQFNKVELVKVVTPDISYEELESLTADAEEVLRRLNLHYRVVALSTGDLGFSSAKTYDLEVWLPGFGGYKEISSCSNFEDFQARRANIRFRDGSTGKLAFAHTLNGSGLAIGRTVAAILENYQTADGRVIVPEVLRPYMRADVIG
ncbi:MAG: serine--tRNA ligase [Actinobacteria bacterium]|nr:serine--tRNA ligase [Actinomycetota bacterium]